MDEFHHEGYKRASQLPGMKPARPAKRDIEAFQKHQDSLSDRLKQHIKSYRVAPTINNTLRKKDVFGRTHYRWIRGMDQVTSHRTTSDHTVYRGFGDNFDISKLNHGDVIHDHGFVSTSFQPNIAQGFHGGSDYNVIAKIHVPKGTKAHYLDTDKKLSRMGDDEGMSRLSELTLHRGTKFKVIKHELHHFNSDSRPDWRDMYNFDSRKIHVVHMEVVGQEPKEIHYDQATQDDPEDSKRPSIVPFWNSEWRWREAQKEHDKTSKKLKSAIKNKEDPEKIAQLSAQVDLHKKNLGQKKRNYDRMAEFMRKRGVIR